MTFARELWKLIRDVLLTLTGVYLFVRVGNGAVPSDLALPVLGAAATLCGLPFALRRDEQRRDR